MSIPCGPCQREGGWTVRRDGERFHPAAATRPFIPPFASPADSVDRGHMPSEDEAWESEPMCSAHGEAHVWRLWARLKGVEWSAKHEPPVSVSAQEALILGWEAPKAPTPTQEPPDSVRRKGEASRPLPGPTQQEPSTPAEEIPL